ncbi:MAG: hypothetical protein Tsb002_15840 [Wenzhouxiangellaceae bacterium]
MEVADFNIGIFGLTHTERAAVASVCKLTRHRKRRYQLIDASNDSNIHIALVDGDDPDARSHWTASSSFHAGRPALLIARDPQSRTADGFNYRLSRGYFAGRLIRTLDEVAMEQFRSLPDFTVDDAGELPIMQNPSKVHFDASAPLALVIDDSEVVRMQMRTLLEMAGMRVALAASAEEGLGMADRNRYDIIFLDIELPEMDGYTACRRLKSKGSVSDCPVVMLTGRDSAFDRIRGVMAGCNRYLIKPVSAENLYLVLNQFVPQVTAST